MISSKFHLTFIIVTALILSITTSYTNAALLEIANNCPYTIWPASFPIGGGRRLDSGQTWTINVPLGTSGGRIWARTGCTFDREGRGRCETGDCSGLLKCQGYGAPPTTVAEYATSFTVHNIDFFDVSLISGFNLPMAFSPNSGNCTLGPRCTADVIGQCPNELRTRGGCNGACSVFETSEYCCTGGICGPTDYSRFFKSQCPEAYSYPTDGANTAFSCPGGSDYRVVFCP